MTKHLEYKGKYRFATFDDKDDEGIPVIYLGYKLGRNRRQLARHIAVNKDSPNIAYEFTGFQFDKEDPGKIFLRSLRVKKLSRGESELAKKLIS